MSEDDGMLATYQLVISVDARKSGEYDDGDKPKLRRRLYHVVEPAFTKVAARQADVRVEDRGDGVLATVAASVPPSGLLGPWLLEVHERLRESNRELARPLGLRVGMHVGPVQEDPWGVSGQAVDLACRLADSDEAKRVLEAARADLVCVVSDQLYGGVVRPGGWGIDPEAYRSARVRTKEGEVTAWFHLPGRGRAQVHDAGGAAQTGDGRPDGAEPQNPAQDRPAPARARKGEGGTAPGSRQIGQTHVHHDPVYVAPVQFGDVYNGPTRGVAGADDE